MSNTQEKKSISFKDLYGMQSEAFYDLIMATDQTWRKQWADNGYAQQNATTEKAYNNLNQTLLFRRAVRENMDDPRWITFNQAKEKGYSVKKGVKGSQVFRLVKDYDRIKRDENKNPILDKDDKPEMETVSYDTPRIKLFTVFNARDIDGIEPFKQAEIPEQHKQLLQQENYKNAEAMIKAFCEKNDVQLQEMASERAFHQYNNGSDDKKVVIPLKSQFNNLDDYFSVLFHEVGHSTKHLGIRINQETDTPMGNTFGSKNYAKEELTAELTALMLCKQFGIDSTQTAEREENSLAYLKSWISQGLLTKEDFNTATIEANRASKAIFEHAPKMTLSLDDLVKNKDISQSNLSISARYGLDDDYIKFINNHINKLLDNKENINIDFSEEVVKLKENLTKQEINALNSIKDNNLDRFNELSIKANSYLENWKELLNLTNNSEAIHNNIDKVTNIISNSENKTELKAVLYQVMENMANKGMISEEEYNNLHKLYSNKLNNQIINNNKNIALQKDLNKEMQPQKTDRFVEQVTEKFSKGEYDLVQYLHIANNNAEFRTSQHLFKGEYGDVKKDPYQEYVNNGYMKLVKESGVQGFVKTYVLTEKGANTINAIYENVLAQESQKQGAKVTKKEIEHLIDTMYNAKSIHAGGTTAEFARSTYPESIIPKIEEAEKLLERPFNKHSLPFKDRLNNVMKLSEEYLKKWDNEQIGKFKFENGAEITQIKVLWTEADSSIENKPLGHDLNKVHEFIKGTYENADWANDRTENPLHPNTDRMGYDKWNIEMTTQTKQADGTTKIETKEFRMDISQQPKDFNPFTREFKDYLAEKAKTPIIEQKPRLSAEIKQVLKQQADKIEHKTSQGVTLH